MRRLFIIRKDLHLSPGKLSAMIGHCAEAYWTNWFRKYADLDGHVDAWVDANILNDYINNSFVKTICEAKNLNHLLKVLKIVEELGLIENEDYGFINDNCRTELTPENEDGTTTVGIWFKPLPDDVSHMLSKKYQLYK